MIYKGSIAGVLLQEAGGNADTDRMSDRSQQTGWEIVRTAQALHPDWTVADHVANLRDAEGQDIDPIWVARWLRNIAADAAH
jgi:hypothetical protein